MKNETIYRKKENERLNFQDKLDFFEEKRTKTKELKELYEVIEQKQHSRNKKKQIQREKLEHKREISQKKQLKLIKTFIENLNQNQSLTEDTTGS